MELLGQAVTAPWIVIAGDWFVDENWFIAPHHSTISSHVGREHFRIVSRIDDPVRDLCGGGLIARILYELRRYVSTDGKSYNLHELHKNNINSAQLECRDNNRKEYQLCGVGRWNPKDDSILKHLVHANCGSAGSGALRSSFCLHSTICAHEPDLELVNLGTASCATTRCIRMFRFSHGRFKLISRIDWDVERPETTPQKSQLDRENVTALFETVIIDDHMKGVINESLLKGIIKHTGADTRWFIRTKDNSVADIAAWPQWMMQINKPITLLMIGPEICCRDYPIDGLLTKKKQLAAHTFDLLDGLTRRSSKRASENMVKNIVLTSDKLEVVSLLETGECFIVRPPQDLKIGSIDNINWTTALFACLAYEMHKKDKVIDKEVLNMAVREAWKHSGVNIPEMLEVSGERFLCNKKGDYDVKDLKSDLEEQWEEQRSQWKQAREGVGLVSHEQRTGGKEKHLEIWRAASDLPGYIALIEEKRESIRRLWRYVHKFYHSSNRRTSLNILLEADPGIGKTHLARTLSKQIECTFISHDIAQMIHRDELLDLFDMVAAAQAEQDVPVFVFVDEINALLDDSPVYGAFLSPLESGTYLRRGNRFQLKPCIWMFAGTPRGDCGTQPEDAREKRKDFESRLTMIEQIDYRSMSLKAGEGSGRVPDQARLEQSYIGAFMINQYFSDVRRIDTDILKLFQSLPPERAPARQIRRLAHSLENVQYGRVHKGNCTSQEWLDVINKEIAAHDRDGWIKFRPDQEIEYAVLDLSNPTG